MRILGLHVSIRRASQVAQETPTLRQRVQRLEIALTEFSEAFTQLSGAHAKLRNQFHGSRGGRPREDDAPTGLNAVPVGDKAALRRALGVVPGARFEHKE